MSSGLNAHQVDSTYVGRLPTDDDDSEGHPAAPVFAANEEEKPRFVHPSAKRMFESCPWVRKIPIFGEACEGYGAACTVSLGLSYLLCKGIADQTLRGATYSMLVVRFGISAERYQRLSPISAMGWSIKAFTAALCDTFAFLGYTKRWYMFISCVLGAAVALAYGLLPAKPSSADIAAAFIFLSCYGKANVDILSEGHYSRLIRKHPEQGPALVSVIWWFIILGSLVASCIYGPLADAGKQQIGIFISAALQFVTCFFYLFNTYGEKINRIERAEDAKLMREEFLAEREKARLLAARVDGHDANNNVQPAKDMHPEHNSDEEVRQDALRDDVDYNENVVVASYSDDHDYELPQPTPCAFGLFEVNKEVAQRNWKIFVYSGVMTCAVIAMTCGNILANTLGILIIVVIVSFTCCCTSFWALPLIIAKVNVFGYLQEVFYLQIAITENFFMGKPECLPNGPHFSFTFYYTISNVIGAVAGILAVTVFNYIFAKHTYRLAFVVTVILRIVAGLFDIVMVKRWNEDVGMPDRAMYICGDAIIGPVVSMLNRMPIIILLSRLCPRGSESVVYALMAGFFNLGQSTSAIIASTIIEFRLPIDSTVKPCTGFEDNLAWVLFIGHICTPLIVIPLTLLLPACRICDNIDLEGLMVAKTMGTAGAASMDGADADLDHMHGYSTKLSDHDEHASGSGKVVNEPIGNEAPTRRET